MEKESSSQKDASLEEKRHPITTIIVALLAVVAGGYLLFPSFGVFELIPDYIPVVGSLDEAAATTLLISALAYFGLDYGHLFGKGKTREKSETAGEKAVKAKVVND